MGKFLTNKIKNYLPMEEAVALSNDKEYITNLFFNMKYPNGYKCECEDCESSEYIYLETRNLYQCKICGKQSSLKSNTVFHDSKLSLSTWFLAIFYLINGQSPKVSAIDLAGNLGVSHKCASLIMYKLALVMLDVNTKHLLEGSIQLDEAFIGGEKEDTKAGKGTSKQSFLCAVSMINGAPIYLNLALNIGNKSDAETFDVIVKKMIVEGSTIATDASTSFSGIKQSYNVNSKKVTHRKNNKLNDTYLKWCDTLISNLKSYIQGIFHGIDKKYLELYFSMFIWRFNKRKTNTIYKIENLIGKCIIFGKIKKTEITKKYKNN